MALSVGTNTGALMAQAAASSVNKSMENSMERLATGKRINSASDDAAGVAIASRLTSEIRGTNQAIRNAMDGQALLDTAEGAHIEIENILQRMREISVQSRNDTNNSADRANLQLEMDALTNEIDRIANSTTWAGQKLLTGNGGNNSNGTFALQVGSRTSAEDTITTTVKAMTAAGLGVGAGNASVGVNGATATEIGESTIKFTGTPAVGDVYKLSIQGEAIEVKIAATNGGDTAFTYQFKSTNHKLNGGAADTFTAAAAVSGASGKTLTDVAKAVKSAIDSIGAGTGADASSIAELAIGDVTGTVNADGTLTVNNPINTTITGVTDEDPAATTNVVDRSVVGQETWKFNAANGKNVNDVNISVNNVVIDLDLQGGNAEYADTTAAMKVAFDAKITTLQAEGKLQGLTFTSSVVNGDSLTGTNDFQVVIASSLTNSVTAVSATAGSSSTALDITTSAAASTSIGSIDAAIISLNNQRASLGSVSNRLDSTVSNLTNISSNLSAGRGRIEDADFAAETTNLAKTQILQQASTAMLAQANASKQGVLSLLQG